jgi:hypothetical protein
MTIHDLQDEEGRVFAFEIENSDFGREKVCNLVQTIPGVRILRSPKKFLSELREEVFLEFEVGGKKFEAWEPFGDNSRYWIGPEPPQWCQEVVFVREAFLQHKP